MKEESLIIDFHTHAFPDALAQTAVAKLRASIGDIYPPVHDGTIAGLLANMDAWGVDTSVVLPVATNAAQVRNVNEWSARQHSDRIISFGSIYPHAEHWKRDIDHAVSLGLRGLKFHAEYQDFEVDDPRLLSIYDYALDQNLILIHHAGFDPAYPEPYRSNPARFARALKALTGSDDGGLGDRVFVIAHLGGHAQWDDVERYLVGTDVHLDTSMGMDFYPHEQFVRIATGHGADRILFGSDAPWSSALSEVEQLSALVLPPADLEAILGGNAKRILGV